MLLPPDFVLIKCLGLRFDVEGRREIARIVDRGEPCVRMWEREGTFPDEAVEKCIKHFEELGAKDLAKEINVLTNKPYLSNVGETKWKLFCQGMLAHPDIFLAGTLREIVNYSDQQIEEVQNIRELETSVRLDAYKSYLTGVVGPKFKCPDTVKETAIQCQDWDGLRPVQAWFAAEALIYFMAMAEVEYLQAYYNIRESKLTLWGVPKVSGGKFKQPLKVFFGLFFDRLISEGYYASLDEIAEKMPRILPLDKKGRDAGKSGKVLGKDSAWREIKRAKYQGKPPSFETFAAWIDALVPNNIYDSLDDFLREKQLLCDLLGAVRIFDAFFRDALKEISEEQLLSHFERYENWYQYHSDRYKNTGSEEDSSLPVA